MAVDFRIEDVMTLGEASAVCLPLFRYNRARKLLAEMAFHEKCLQFTTEKSIGYKVQLEALSEQLEVNPLIPHTRDMYRELIGNSTNEDIMRSLYGRYLRPTGESMSDLEQKVCDRMQRVCVKGRGVSYATRLADEMVRAEERGWYIVFNTLTVRPGELERVFHKKSKAFSRYIQKVERAIMARFGPIRTMEQQKKDGIEFHKYFAVVERGTLGRRLHIHVLHFCRKLPNDVDPNRGKAIPSRRECLGFRGFWEYGFVKPYAVRSNAMDSYAKLGWAWPVEKQETGGYAPIKAKSVYAMARYVTKYVTKAYVETKQKDAFRCRMTRNLGTETARKIVETLSDPALMIVSQLRDPRLVQIPGRMKVDLRTLRRLCHKRILRQLPETMLMPAMLRISPRPGLIERLRTMTRKNRTCSSQSIGRIETRNMTNTVIFDREVFDEITDVCKRIVPKIGRYEIPSGSVHNRIRVA